MINSFINSYPLYQFLLNNFYIKYPSLVNGNQTKYHAFRYINFIDNTKIYCNFIMDFISNGILPIIIPILNIYLILFLSDTVIDAILNSLALFFIIKLDEELFSLSSFESEKLILDFYKWTIGNIWSNTFHVWNEIFVLGYDSWFNTIFEIVYRTKNENKEHLLIKK